MNYAEARWGGGVASGVYESAETYNIIYIEFSAMLFLILGAIAKMNGKNALSLIDAIEYVNVQTANDIHYQI